MNVLVGSLYLMVLSHAGCMSSAEYVNALSDAAGLTGTGGVKLRSTTYRGKTCVELTQDTDVAGLGVGFPVDFKDGTIEFDVAGILTPVHDAGARGFAGIAFRGTVDFGKYECFYLRMANGRAQDQEQRNHAVQYCMFPDNPWDKLRAQFPSRYEAYTDLEPGGWTHVKISVQGPGAQFYVGDAKQPTLIVQQLFMGATHGKLALWTSSYTKAYFANLSVRTS